MPARRHNVIAAKGAINEIVGPPGGGSLPKAIRDMCFTQRVCVFHVIIFSNRVIRVNGLGQAPSSGGNFRDRLLRELHASRGSANLALFIRGSFRKLLNSSSSHPAFRHPLSTPA